MDYRFRYHYRYQPNDDLRSHVPRRVRGILSNTLHAVFSACLFTVFLVLVFLLAL